MTVSVSGGETGKKEKTIPKRLEIEEKRRPNLLYN